MTVFSSVGDTARGGTDDDEAVVEFFPSLEPNARRNTDTQAQSAQYTKDNHGLAVPLSWLWVSSATSLGLQQ